MESELHSYTVRHVRASQIFGYLKQQLIGQMFFYIHFVVAKLPALYNYDNCVSANEESPEKSLYYSFLRKISQLSGQRDREGPKQVTAD